MKKDNIVKLLLAIIVIVFLAYVSIFGLEISGKKIIKGAKYINTGLDISGGVTITYQATSDGTSDITDEDLKKSEIVIRKRLEKRNVYDYIIRRDATTSQISIEIPSNNNDTSKDPLSVVEGLDKTAKIEFRDPDGNVVLSGDDIKSAKFSDDPVDSTGLPAPHVVLHFSEEGSKKFADATEKLVGKVMAIYLDDTLVADPLVNSKIESNTAIITVGDGKYSERKKQAEEYALLIDSGTLPFSLKVINKEYIGPYVGQQALNISIKAGIIALVLIAIIMIAIYRLSGIVATFALIAYCASVLLIMSNTGISLTLSGIAGLILSIGMAVDANVIIFERFKEELKQKMSCKKAFEKSLKNAIVAIIDGNITTFIVAILLYIFGIGPIKGFGIVLAIGVVVSLFTSIFVTKFILKQILPATSKNTFLCGLKKEAK